MRYLLDTNICIYLIKGKFPSVRSKFKQCMKEDVGVSSVSIAELEYGVAKSGLDKQRKKLDVFLPQLSHLSFDGNAAKIYGAIRSRLEVIGKPIGSMDMLIAAHAMALGATLVTNNSREFNRVQGLKLENWTIP
jgi:tRNA(fMet)-specific endonuclease VapC